MIFRAIASLDLYSIQPALIIACMFAKLIIFSVGCLVGALATPSRHAGPGARLTYAGAVSIFVTASDDLALGLPFFDGVFSPELTQMLFVMSAVQMLIVAPPSLLLLGMGRLRRDGGGAAASSSSSLCAARYPQMSMLLAIVLTVVKNRLIIAAVLGLAYNLALGHGLPWWLDDPVAAVAAAFPPLALMTGGMSLVGASRTLDSIDKLGLPLAVVAVKVLLLPVTARLLALGFGVGEEQGSFAFEFGLLPTAAAAIIIVRQAVGEHHSEMVLLLAGAYAISKAASMLLLLIFAVLLTVPEEDVRRTVARLAASLQMASAVSAACIALPVLLVPAMRKRRGFELSELLVLVLLQLGFAVGAASFGAASVGEETILHLQGPGAQALAYAVVNVCRWAIDGWLLTMCVRLVIRARRAVSFTTGGPAMAEEAAAAAAAAGAVAGSEAALSEVAVDVSESTSANRPTGSRHLQSQRRWVIQAVFSLALALALTLPWVLSAQYPDDPLLPLWILSSSQAAACAVAYGMLSVALAACLIALVYFSKKATRARTSPDALAEGQAASERSPTVGAGRVSSTTLSQGGSSPTTPMASAARIRPPASDAAAIELRVGVLCACALIRNVVAMLMCASLARDPRIDGIVAQLLMVLLFFVDGQGVLSLALYASHPLVVKGIMRSARMLHSRCASCAVHYITPAAVEVSDIDEYGVMLPSDVQQVESSGLRRQSRRAHASWRKLRASMSTMSTTSIDVPEVPAEVHALREL